MNEPLSDELLSAYLDGELSREERARVEDWLTASAEHRRLLEDLKAIRRELQALPKQSLDAGFSDRVLAAIRERAGQAGSAPPAAGGSSPTPDPAQTIPIKPVNLPDGRLGMPSWRWFAAGVAATLLAVIVGMNAAPETMAQMGRLAQVVQPAVDNVTKKQAESLREGKAATAAPGETAPVELEATQAEGSGSGGRQHHSGAVADATNKDLREAVADNVAKRKEAAPGQHPVEPKVEAPAPPLAAADAVPAAEARLDSFDEKDGHSDGRDSVASEGKKPAGPGIANGQAAVAYADVVELPITTEQAERALAFYAQTGERQAARRYRNVVTLAVSNADENSADRFAEDDRGSVLQRSAPGRSLMKLMDAAAQGVEVAALEVTGPEAEVQALLDSLGVAEARDLRPSREMVGSGAGGVGVVRANREGEEAVAGEFKPAAAAAAAGKEIAKADGILEKKPAEAKGGSPPPKSVSRGGANGGFPSFRMRSAYDGNEVARDQARRALASHAEGGDSAQPQLRVRLVFVPTQADPIGPTVEIKPTE